MILLIDVGNTNSKFAVHDGENWGGVWRAATSAQRTADEHAVWLHAAMALAGLDFSAIKACVIASVVPQGLFHLRNLSRRYLNCDPLIVGENAKLGMEVRIPKPAEAGADRLVSAIGGFNRYGGPLLVVDSGTATTFDVIGADGAFEGGLIAPGIDLSLRALHEAAARLPRVEIKKPAKVIGTDTVGAMQAGVFWGYVSLIDGLIEAIRAEYGQPMTVVATGGVASLFDGASEKIDHYDPELALAGLLEIYRRNMA